MESSPSTKAARLRRLLESPRTEFLMEAHDGISARIVEEAGFAGIWASGLALSAQCGVRDNNELSWTQLAERWELMADATSVPILVDGDTGFGNFNNLRRLVGKLEQRGIAGLCIEDKLFPKTNSFLSGERQPLAEVEEFCGKVRAAKDSQRDPDFVLVARVEALIAGWGLEEALLRAEAYREAGADAVLVHSRRPRPNEVLAFAAQWAGRAPLVIVPTTYGSTPAEVFERAGIRIVIWANHMLRSAVRAMQRTARDVAAARGVAGIEEGIAPLAEIFRLQGADELARAEERYLAPSRRHTRAVVLAASRGAELEGLTAERPKVMVEIGGRPLLRRLVDAFKARGVNDVTVVAGYRADAIDVPGVEVVENEGHAETGELASLACAAQRLGEDTVVLYGDLLFRSYILESLLEAPGELVAVVDSQMPAEGEGGSRDFAWCSAPDDRSLFEPDVRLMCVSGSPDERAEPPSGRFIGMLRLRGQGRRWVLAAIEELRGRPGFGALDLPDLLNHMIARGRPVRALYVAGHWLDVNSVEDLDRAGRFAPEAGGGERR